ncbi:MAG: hypothetical protein JXQ73_17085 [Phycisphaerae bacterium]|nr:hypothetical protein [Phycisphaerae bacterium]
MFPMRLFVALAAILLILACCVPGCLALEQQGTMLQADFSVLGEDIADTTSNALTPKADKDQEAPP